MTFESLSKYIRPNCAHASASRFPGVFRYFCRGQIHTIADMPEYHPCLRLTLQSRRQIESNKSPLPCSLCALALNTGNPRFVRTGGLCSSPRPEDSGRGWVLWSSGFAGHAASGGTARTVPPPLSPARHFISASLIKFAAPECRSEPGQTLPRI